MEETAAAIKPTLHVVLEALLAWPFLVFVLFVIVLYLARGQIAEIVRTRQIDVSLGGNSISIGDAVNELDLDREQALEDYRRHEEEIAGLKRELEELRNGISGQTGDEAVGADGPLPPDEEPPDVGRNRRPGSFDRMLRSLGNNRYRWRTLERLAIEARVSEDEALDTLQAHSDQVVIGKSRAGKVLARLKEPGDH